MNREAWDNMEGLRLVKWSEFGSWGLSVETDDGEFSASLDTAHNIGQLSSRSGARHHTLDHWQRQAVADWYEDEYR